MDAQLLAQLRQTINVATLVSANALGDPTYSAPTAVACRLEDEQRDEDNPDREQTVSRKRIITAVQINRTDRIWLPGDSTSDTSLARKPEQVQMLPDEFGNADHWETIV